jgi:hypothetical protein
MVKKKISKKKSHTKTDKTKSTPKGVPRNIPKGMFTKGKVCEVFEVEKDGKEKLVKACGQENLKVETKNQIAHEDKLLRNIFLVLGIIIAGFLFTFMVFYSMSNFESDGVKFNIIKEKSVTFYHTSFPSNFVTTGRTIEYNVYLRNDPRELKNIPFEGNLNLLEIGVIENKSNFDCEGDGVIAVANFNNVLGAMGTQVIRDPEASCDSSGRYNYFELKSGDETKIVQTGPACYDFFIKDCEILDATEKFLVESLSAI